MRRLIFYLCFVLGFLGEFQFVLPVAAAEPCSVSFREGAWNPAQWLLVKSPRWKNIGAWVQKAEWVENAVPADASPQEMLGRRAPETYASMLWKIPQKGDYTVSARMLFTDQMAPLLVWTAGPGADAGGYPEYREHWEAVLWNQGINIWHHEEVNGRVKYHLAACLKHPFSANQIYELKVRVRRKPQGGELTIFCGNVEFSYLEHGLPDSLFWGITGCEGINRFYDFRIECP